MRPALKKLDPAIVRKMQQQVMDCMVPSEEKRMEAYKRGQRAAFQGWARVSPYYEQPMLDQHFFKGFDEPQKYC
jgi:hypothetical protein